jgi:hypothetical protein
LDGQFFTAAGDPCAILVAQDLIEERAMESRNGPQSVSLIAGALLFVTGRTYGDVGASLASSASSAVFQWCISSLDGGAILVATVFGGIGARVDRMEDEDRRVGGLRVSPGDSVRPRKDLCMSVALMSMAGSHI